ncbi:MAG: anthranilate synthase component I [Armatimonadetes bacterium]|nr:anthranilate synthase component I [Armatimonadota bacterium]
MLRPTLEEFLARARPGAVIPVYRDILADLETPVSAFLKVGNRPHAFLLESVEGGERIGRYSFIGGEPALVMKTRGRDVEIFRDGERQLRKLAEQEDPLHVLKSLMGDVDFIPDPGLPPFCGGAVGYLAYDVVRFFEHLPDMPYDDLELPDAYFVFTDTLLIFDHVQHHLKILCNARVDGDPRAAYQQAADRIDAVVELLQRPLVRPAAKRPQAGPIKISAMREREAFEYAVRQGKEYIAAGDVIQVVLSQRLSAETSAPSFEIYRALRSVNPSPYMFFLQFEDCHLVGASPEILVTERGGQVVTRPIAGTVPRGCTPEEDAALEAHLKADPKERAEHIMLVDLHRNDIGRVCEYGSVCVDQLMVTEKYSHVSHLVSNVVGRLRNDCDAYDLLRACFPAGTVSGAPKVRAMEIIDELEPVKRGPYAGAIGYFSYSGDMDTAITLRTVVMQGQTAYVQAGAGIVADSVPEREYEECFNKAAALLRAIELAETGLE